METTILGQNGDRNKAVSVNNKIAEKPLNKDIIMSNFNDKLAEHWHPWPFCLHTHIRSGLIRTGFLSSVNKTELGELILRHYCQYLVFFRICKHSCIWFKPPLPYYKSKTKILFIKKLMQVLSVAELIKVYLVTLKVRDLLQKTTQVESCLILLLHFIFVL